MNTYEKPYKKCIIKNGKKMLDKKHIIYMAIFEKNIHTYKRNRMKIKEMYYFLEVKVKVQGVESLYQTFMFTHHFILIM